MNNSYIHPLPCPFCGSAPDVFPKDPKREGNAFGQVRCSNNDCPAKPCVNDDVDVCDERGPDAYKAAAIRVWNTRHSPENDDAKAALLWRIWSERILDLPPHNFPSCSTFEKLRTAMATSRPDATGGRS